MASKKIKKYNMIDGYDMILSQITKKITIIQFYNYPWLYLWWTNFMWQFSHVLKL